MQLMEMHEPVANGYLSHAGTSFDDKRAPCSNCHRRYTAPAPPVDSGGEDDCYDDEDEEEMNRLMWKKICDSLDTTCFYGFGFISIFAPLLVVAFLDHKMMGV